VPPRREQRATWPVARCVGPTSTANPSQHRCSDLLLRRVHDYALKRLGGDSLGLDEGGRRFLRAILERFDGGPVGIESLAAALAEDRDTLEYVHEPYLIQEGFLVRTPRGRVASAQAFEHLKVPMPKRNGQGSLF
jgi:holliday junction DNA helicase RuvB